MKNVISASRRTDIPAFYLSWFIDAVKSGKIKVRNPYNKKIHFDVKLDPASVEWIVFWSRNYASFLKHNHFFIDYNLFFHFTIVTHHPMMEQNYLQTEKALKQIEMLANIYGSDHIIWRYDPIVIWENNSTVETNFQRPHFEFLCSKMSEIGVKSCYFSFVSEYAKFKQRLKKISPKIKLLQQSESEKFNILQIINDISNKHKIQLYSCCNDRLTGNGILKGSCISGYLLNRLSDKNKISEAKTATRKDCGCTKSIDIGDYDMQPCYFGCIYCYANPVINQNNPEQ